MFINWHWVFWVGFYLENPWGCVQDSWKLNSANGKNKVLNILELPWRPAVAGRSPQYLDDSQPCESSLLNGNFWFRMGQIMVTFFLMTYMEIRINELIF